LLALFCFYNYVTLVNTVISSTDMSPLRRYAIRPRLENGFEKT